MANFTLKLGSIDLSPYTRMDPEEGFDPASADAIAGQFGDTPFSDGQPLLFVQASNKDFVIPMHLKAVDKQTLHNLVRTIRDTIDSKPVTLEWADVGATSSTFFDIEWGKFTPEYNFRRAGYNYLSGTLHLNVRPYGHTGTTRIIATRVASGNQYGFQITVPIGSVAGDIAPLIEVTNFRAGIATSSHGQPTSGDALDALGIVSLLTDPNYQAQFRSSLGEITSGIGSPTAAIYGKTVADANGVGSSALEIGWTGSQLVGLLGQERAMFYLNPLSAYRGRNRVFAVVSPFANAGSPSQGFALRLTGDNIGAGINTNQAPTVVASDLALSPTYGSIYYTLDLGTFDVPTSPDVKIPTVARMQCLVNPISGAPTGMGQVAAGATYAIRFTEFIVVPEDTTFLHNKGVNPALTSTIDNYQARVDGVNGQQVFLRISGANIPTYYGDIDIPANGGVRGDLRTLDLTQASHGDLFIAQLPTWDFNFNPAFSGYDSLNPVFGTAFYSTVKVRERFTYAR